MLEVYQFKIEEILDKSLTPQNGFVVKTHLLSISFSIG